MTIETRLRELASKAHVGGAEKWVPYMPVVARKGDAFVKYEDGIVVARIPKSITPGGTFVHNRLAAYIASLDPSTVLRLLDVVEKARNLRHAEKTEDYPMGLTEMRQEELDAALSRLDEGEK